MTENPADHDASAEGGDPLQVLGTLGRLQPESDSDPTVVEPTTKKTPRQRRRRRRLVGLVSCLVMVAGAATYWTLQASPPPPAEPPAYLSGAVLVRQQLAQVEQGESSQIVIRSGEVSDQDLQPLAGNANIKTVLIEQGQISDAGLATLATLPHLRHLRLRFSPITDEGLAKLAACPELQILNLPHARCRAEGLRSLRSLQHLHQLRLGSPLAGNGIGRAIRQLASLRAVHLIEIPITDEGLQQIADLPHLESLYLDGAAVTALYDDMAERAGAVVARGAPDRPTRANRIAFMRYRGQGHEIPVDVPDRALIDDDAALLAERFRDAYTALFGRALPHASVEVTSWGLRVEAEGADLLQETGKRRAEQSDRTGASPAALADDVIARADLAAGQSVEGPAVITEETTTTFVPAGVRAELLPSGALLLTANQGAAQ
jgi:hypothetical protein